ncbi:MAG TPA: hypothetical protein VFI73_00905, partial [Candidatus Nitrosopolaris sp.]|nr:hypothetical protein [Candidatus Nitrosopolaris sp.]
MIRKGVLSLAGSRHSQFFKNLIQASRTEEGGKAIEHYANSDSEIPPDLSGFVTHKIQDPGEEIQAATPQELAQLLERTDPLDYGEPETVEQILKNTSLLESVNVDEEAMRFYVAYSVDELWKRVFRQEEEKPAVHKLRLEGKNGKEYHDTVIEPFLSDYEGTRAIKLSPGYNFKDPQSSILYYPTLMQSYVA